MTFVGHPVEALCGRQIQAFAVEEKGDLEGLGLAISLNARLLIDMSAPSAWSPRNREDAREGVTPRLRSYHLITRRDSKRMRFTVLGSLSP